MNLLDAAGRRAAGRIADLSREPGTDERRLRAAILDVLRGAITFDAYAWLLTDPSTEVGTAPLAEVPDVRDLPRLIAAKYLTTVNRWTVLPAGRSATLHEATGGALERSRLWREVLSPYGVTDVVSISFRDKYGIWGFLDLWRRDAAGSVFTPADRALLDSVHQPVTGALRSVVAQTFATAASKEAAGPSVLLLTDELAPLGQTTDVEGRLRDLLPTAADRSSGARRSAERRGGAARSRTGRRRKPRGRSRLPGPRALDDRARLKNLARRARSGADLGHHRIAGSG